MRDASIRRAKSSPGRLARAHAKTPTSAPGQSRWTLWARGISSRYSMLQKRPPAIAMVLGRSAEFLQIVRRKTLRSVNLYPTINLSINNVLQTLYSSSERTLTAVGESTRDSRRKSLNGTPSYGLSMIRPTPISYLRASHRTQIGEENDRVVEIARSRPSLVRALQRLEARDQLLISTERIVQAKEELMSVASRVRARSSRVESRPQDRVPISARGASLVLRKSGQIHDPIDRSDVVDFRAKGIQQQQAVDVHSLTEEVIRRIDSKTTAWRERMGRI